VAIYPPNNTPEGDAQKALSKNLSPAMGQKYTYAKKLKHSVKKSSRIWENSSHIWEEIFPPMGKSQT
jgi:hypothetical protein